MQTQPPAPAMDAANSKRLAAMWPGFVGLDKRRERETPFILRHASKPEPDVFDACLGCGATTIGLKLAGLDGIISNEIDPNMKAVAIAEAGKRGLGLDIVGYDWRELTSLSMGKFDLVTCLGNSLTYIFDREGQVQALLGFASLLSHGGVLMIDERNYPAILDGRFSQSGDYVYCGTEVSCMPYIVSPERVVMEYVHHASGDAAYLTLYPFKRGEVQELLAITGFRDVRVFGDYQADFDPAQAEFFTYVARI